GRGVAIAALAASIVGNAVGHILARAAAWALTAIVSAVPPVALATALHLRALRTEDRRSAGTGAGVVSHSQLLGTGVGTNDSTGTSAGMSDSGTGEQRNQPAGTASGAH